MLILSTCRIRWLLPRRLFLTPNAKRGRILIPILVVNGMHALLLFLLRRRLFVRVRPRRRRRGLAIIVRRLDQRPIHLDDAPFLIFRIGSVASYQIVGLVGGEEFELGEAGVVRLEGRFGGLCLLGWLGGIVGCRS